MPNNILQRLRNRTKGNSFQKIWLRLVGAAVLAVLLPMSLLGAWFYDHWADSQLEGFRLQGANRLRGIALTIEQNLHMVDNDVLMLKQSNVFLDFVRMSRPGEHVEELQAVHDRLVEMSMKYAFIQSAYFYDPRCRAFSTNISATYDEEEFYDRSWLDRMTSSHNINRIMPRVNVDLEVLADPRRARALAYRPETVITVAGTGAHGIRIAVNISAQRFYEYLNLIYTFSGDDFSVVDSAGLLVLGADAARLGKPYGALAGFSVDSLDPEADSFLTLDGHHVFVHPMQGDNLFCILSYPDDTLGESLRMFRNYILLVGGFLALAVILATLFMTRRIYSPVTALFGSIRSLPAPGRKQDETLIRDEIAYIKELFNDLAGDRKAMESTLTEYERALRTHRFRNHLDGLTTYGQLQADWPDPIDFEHRAGCFVALRVVHAKGAAAPAAARANVVELIGAYVANAAQGLFFDLEGDLYVACLATEREADLAALAAMVKRLLGEILGARVHAARSATTHHPDELVPAYQQALAGCRHAVFFGLDEGVADGSVLPPAGHGDFSDVINDETAIIRSILFQDTQAVQEGIATLKSHILRHPDAESARGVILRLLTTLENEFRLGTLLGGNIFEPFYALDTFADMLDYLSGLVRRTVEHLARSRETQQDYCARAKAYLEANYRNASLSVCGIADELGISYPYLSKIFKDATGMGLLDYLNAIRIEKGKEALLHRNDNLSAVAELVGYSNTQSFQRFFKKLVGVTPGEYRRACG